MPASVALGMAMGCPCSARCVLQSDIRNDPIGDNVEKKFFPFCDLPLYRTLSSLHHYCFVLSSCEARWATSNAIMPLWMEMMHARWHTTSHGGHHQRPLPRPNKQWQGYVAMAAAAYAKQLLVGIAFNKAEHERKTTEYLFSSQYFTDISNVDRSY
jgi:hypothetical protein